MILVRLAVWASLFIALGKGETLAIFFFLVG